MVQCTDQDANSEISPPATMRPDSCRHGDLRSAQMDNVAGVRNIAQGWTPATILLRPPYPSVSRSPWIGSPELDTSRPCATCLGTLTSPLWLTLARPVVVGELATIIATNRARQWPPSFSGRRASPSNSPATAVGAYKLPTPPAPLSSCATSEATRASNHPLELPILGFPPNHSRTPSGVTSPWLAHLRSAHTLCSFVSTSLCAPDAPRPRQLS
jgi:hypothetical protein